MDLQQINIKSLEDRNECLKKISNMKFEERRLRHLEKKWTGQKRKFPENEEILGRKEKN